MNPTKPIRSRFGEQTGYKSQPLADNLADNLAPQKKSKKADKTAKANRTDLCGRQAIRG